VSVKELVLKDTVDNLMKFVTEGSGFILKIDDLNGKKNAYLDRNQAHLLYLYLKENLGMGIKH